MTFSQISGASFSAVGNPIAFEVSSPNYTYCSFKYIADLYVRGDLVARLRLNPNEEGNAIFDPSNILSNYVHSEIPVNLIGFTHSTNTYCPFEVKFGEEYDSSPICGGLVSGYYDQATTGELYCFNGANQFEDGILNTNLYFADQTAPTQFLTTIPDNTTIRLGEEYILSFLTNTNPDAYRLNIDTFDINGNTYSRWRSPNNPYSNLEYTLQSVGVGPENISDGTMINISGYTASVLNDNVYYYDAYLTERFSGLSSRKVRFYLDRTPVRYPGVRLTWLNSLGGFDSYTFTLNNKSTLAITRNEYEQYLGKKLQNGTYGWDQSDRGRTRISTTAKESILLTSNWMKKEVAFWLQDLWLSIDTYEQVCNSTTCLSDNYYNGDVLYRATNVTDNTYEYKDGSNGKLIQYQINVERAYDKNIQRA